MESATIFGAVAGAVGALLLVALVALLRRRSRSRADLEAMLAAAQREADDLRQRLEEPTRASGVGPVREVTDHGVTNHGATNHGLTNHGATEYVITDIGREPAEPVEPIAVPDRLVLSATLGAPVVKVAAFAHGVRRALSPETRNRIRFEMGREVRASRKRRRREVREHLRHVRAQERASG